MRKVKATGGVFGAELECLATLGELIGGCVSAEEIEGWARTPDDEAAPAPNPVAAR